MSALISSLDVGACGQWVTHVLASRSERRQVTPRCVAAAAPHTRHHARSMRIRSHALPPCVHRFCSQRRCSGLKCRGWMMVFSIGQTFRCFSSIQPAVQLTSGIPGVIGDSTGTACSGFSRRRTATRRSDSFTAQCFRIQTRLGLFPVAASCPSLRRQSDCTLAVGSQHMQAVRVRTQAERYDLLY